MNAIVNFEYQVLKFVRRIPAGRVSTYRSLARAIGQPRAARAVGNALKKNPRLVTTPCHRVVRSNGAVGGYRQGTRRKAALLRAEGVSLDGHNKVIDFNRVCYQF